MTAIQAHEYSATPSHYSEAAAALGANNPGVAAERVIATPSQAGSIQQMVDSAAQAAYQAAFNAGKTEPPTNLPSNINYPPYQPLPGGCN